MRRPRLALSLALSLLPACDGSPAAVDVRPDTPRSAMLAPATRVVEDPSTPAPAPRSAAATRAEVVIVELGPPVPEHLLDAIEAALRDELQVEVVRREAIPLPRAAWYAPRKRWRADVLLEHLLGLVEDAPASTRVLGVTTKDISVTKGEHHDWGVFGYGYMPGRAAVISTHRLRRGAKDRAHLEFRVATTAVHEVGHTLGLDHCPEAAARCPMQDAQGGIENTDTSTGHLGPQCREKLEAAHPLRAAP